MFLLVIDIIPVILLKLLVIACPSAKHMPVMLKYVDWIC